MDPEQAEKERAVEALRRAYKEVAATKIAEGSGVSEGIVRALIKSGHGRPSAVRKIREWLEVRGYMPEETATPSTDDALTISNRRIVADELRVLANKFASEAFPLEMAKSALNSFAKGWLDNSHLIGD